MFLIVLGTRALTLEDKIYKHKMGERKNWTVINCKPLRKPGVHNPLPTEQCKCRGTSKLENQHFWNYHSRGWFRQASPVHIKSRVKFWWTVEHLHNPKMSLHRSVSSRRWERKKHIDQIGDQTSPTRGRGTSCNSKYDTMATHHLLCNFSGQECIIWI